MVTASAQIFLMAGDLLKFLATAGQEGESLRRGRRGVTCFNGFCGQHRTLAGSRDSRIEDTGLVEDKSCGANQLGPKLTERACSQSAVPHMPTEGQGSRDIPPTSLYARIWNRDECCSGKTQEQSMKNPHCLQKLAPCVHHVVPAD